MFTKENLPKMIAAIGLVGGLAYGVKKKKGMLITGVFAIGAAAAGYVVGQQVGKRMS